MKYFKATMKKNVKKQGNNQISQGNNEIYQGNYENQFNETRQL